MLVRLLPKSLLKELVRKNLKEKLERNFGITLKGLEYLEENATMKKAAALLKGIKETVPGL